MDSIKRKFFVDDSVLASSHRPSRAFTGKIGFCPRQWAMPGDFELRMRATEVQEEVGDGGWAAVKPMAFVRAVRILGRIKLCEGG